MMDEPIPYRCFVDFTRFWVVDLESVIPAMPIDFIRKVVVKFKDIVHKCQRKLRYIFALLFVP